MKNILVFITFLFVIHSFSQTTNKSVFVNPKDINFREEKFARELLYTLGFEFISSGPELGWKLLPSKLPEVVPSLKQRKWQTELEI